MIYLLLSLLGLFLFLTFERLLLEQRLRKIPLRISVTGTRGKSAVVRMLASVLREDGRRVVAKTTGAQAFGSFSVFTSTILGFGVFIGPATAKRETAGTAGSPAPL